MSTSATRAKIIQQNSNVSCIYSTLTALPRGLWRNTFQNGSMLVPDEAVKGGLRTVQAREAAHARLMKARLRELGESSKSEIPQERHENEIPFFSSSEHSDEEKLKVLSDLFGDGEEFLRPVTDVINQITDDLQTKELLRTILDDERESVDWIQGMYKTMSTQAS